MSRFLESICFDGTGYPLLAYHQRRVDRVFEEVYKHGQSLVLRDILPMDLLKTTIHKVRVLYNNIHHRIVALPYTIRDVNSLQLIISDDILYDHKYANRRELEQLFEQRNTADDILIVRNGLLTDTSYANIALLKNNRWHTPEQPLLPGVRRSKLLDEGLITTATIHVEDLSQFEQLSLFNAMIDLGEISIPIENILK